MRKSRGRFTQGGAPLGRVALLLMVAASCGLGYTAKLVREDGQPFSAVPLILPPLTANWCLVLSIGLDGTIQYDGPQAEYVPKGVSTSEPRATVATCQAAFVVQGYGKITATLRDGAVIVLRRSGEGAEGLAVSVGTLQAPPAARKAWEKGIKALDNKKWSQAERELRRAVTMHSEYATAWSALGEALIGLSRPADARAAWERAIQADPKYVKPYVLLGQLAVREGRMKDAIAITARAIEDRYTQSLPVYYYNAVANFAIGRLEPAEQSARKAIELDPGHMFPKCENLLGPILATKGDRNAALEHMKRYLQISPAAEDAQQVKKKIAELERSGNGVKGLDSYRDEPDF